MFFSYRIVVFSFFVLTSINECISNVDIKCEYSEKARDQKLILNKLKRRKRFVLFPEFKLWLNDWRYLNHPKEFVYWISNYYPEKIDTNHVRSYIDHIINNINKVLNKKISSVRQASSPDKANFHYNFFNYEICPTDDPLATTNYVQNIEPILIYPRHVIKQNRYRAHGGILLNYENNSTKSYMKFNIHHTFLLHQDFQYDPVEYKCNSDETHCIMDLYAVMLHETLHGFGIEHTEISLPNNNFIAVMHLYASRMMCHDDIRAIRMVYGLSVKRQNSKYDDTCRRDFPLNPLQKIMTKIHRSIVFYTCRFGLSISFIVFLLTNMYITMRKCHFHINNYDESSSLQSFHSQHSYEKQNKSAINAFLWHNDYFNH